MQFCTASSNPTVKHVNSDGNIGNAPIIFIIDWDDTIFPCFGFRGQLPEGKSPFYPIKAFIKDRNLPNPWEYVKQLKDFVLKKQASESKKNIVQFQLVTRAKPN